MPVSESSWKRTDAPLKESCCIRPSQTVGTPAEKVTFSFSNSSHRLSPSSLAPGNTSLAPIMAATYGMLQALTWNIGTTGRITSRADRFITSGRGVAKACSTMERCE